MNRKEFLFGCAGGLCACGGAAAQTPAKQSGVTRRYAKLLEILGQKMDAKTLDETLEELGRSCSAGISWIGEMRGKPEEYFKELKKRWNEDATYDKEKGVITIASAERTECTCPLIGPKTPPVVCNCSLGWQKQTFETVLGKKVRVELKEAVLRGGKRCVFEIHVV